MAFNILIVDDSATTRAIIKRTIQMANLPVNKIHEAANGKLGLQVLSANAIDLVLADLHMPEMDGAEMLRQMLADDSKKSIPVIICSAEPNADRINQLQNQGITGYLRKPFTPEALCEKVTSIMGAAHA